MLATLADEAPRDESNWTYELKYDGFRAISAIVVYRQRRAAAERIQVPNRRVPGEVREHHNHQRGGEGEVRDLGDLVGEVEGAYPAGRQPGGEVAVDGDVGLDRDQADRDWHREAGPSQARGVLEGTGDQRPPADSP